MESNVSGISGVLTAVIAAVILFAVIVVWPSQQKQRLEHEELNIIADQVRDDIVARGYISADMLGCIAEACVRTSCSYEFIHSQPVYDGDGRTAYWTKTYTGEIVESIDRNGAYLLSIGDRIEIEITGNAAGPADRLMQRITGRGRNEYVRVSGSVEDIEMSAYVRYFS